MSVSIAFDVFLYSRFDHTNKHYVLYYNPEMRQHFVGSKFFDNILDLVQDGLIHMFIETRGAEILRKIAEAQVYEATPFYQVTMIMYPLTFIDYKTDL